MDISRRELFKLAGMAAIGATVGQFGIGEAAKKNLALKSAPVVGSRNVTGQKFSGTAAKV